MKSGILSTSVGALLVLIALPAASRSDVSPPLGMPVAVEASPAQSPPSFLGFQRGEERRYVLGPQRELGTDEHAAWSMRLRELLGDPPDGVFELTHQWQRRASSTELPIGTITRIGSEGKLRVNGYGFPIELRFTTERHLVGMGDEIYTVRYRFQDGGFVKHLAMDGQEVEHAVGIGYTDDLDLSVPSGLHAFTPAGVDCSTSLPLDPRRVTATLPPKRTAGSDPSPTMPATPPRFALNTGCSESLFANPGLISLMLPVLWEEGTGEHEFLMLTPAGPFGMPGPVAGVALGGMSVRSGRADFDSETASSPRTNSDVEKLRYIDRVRVEVGGRARDAWRFDGMRAFDAIYVDDDGVVLRVDLADSVWDALLIGGLTGGVDLEEWGTRELWIRLLSPSEY